MKTSKPRNHRGTRLLRLAAATATALTLLLTGCWQRSVHPFYTDADVVPEPRLTGAWTATPSPVASTPSRPTTCSACWKSAGR